MVRQEPSGLGHYPVGDAPGFAMAMAIRSLIDARAQAIDEKSTGAF